MSAEEIHEPQTQSKWPPGDHPLEIAARSGFGPLSPLGREVWDGYASPCVTCGQLVRREAISCHHCGQDLSPHMIQRMREHAGPWYVLEHVRPFPGVTLERIIRQIRRGLITETSIIRGPATDYQWRYAVQTPGLCRLFGRCWNCHAPVAVTQVRCPACLSNLGIDDAGSPKVVPTPHPAGETTRAPGSSSSSSTANEAAGEPERPLSHRTARAGRAFHAEFHSSGGNDSKVSKSVADAGNELLALQAVVEAVPYQARSAHWESPAPPVSLKMIWLPVAAVLLMLIFLFWAAQSRSHSTSPPRPPEPAILAPAAIDGP